MRTSTDSQTGTGGFRTILEDRSVVTVILLSFVIMAGFGLVLPILPLFARSFGVGYQAAGLLTSAFGLTRLGADLLAGGLVDRMGERTAASGGLLLLAVCALGTALAGNFTLAVVVWAVGGLGSAVMFAAQYSYLLKVVPKTSMARTLGLFYGSFNVGIIAGGVIGGIVADRFGLAAPLFVYSGVLLLAAALYLRFIPPPRPRAADPGLTTESVLAEREAPGAVGPFSRLGALLRTRGFVTVLVVNFAYMWMVTAVFDTLIPLFGQDRLGMSTVGIGTAFAVAIGVEFLVLYPAGSLADRRGRKAVMVPALTFLAFMTAVVGSVGNVAALFVAMGFLGIASGFAGVPPAAMLSDVVPEESSGTGVGAFRFAGDLSFFLGPLVAGWSINTFGFRPAFAVAAIPSVLALLLVLRTPETMPRGESPNVS